MHTVTLWQIFFSEFLGTAVLMTLGTAACANNTLRSTKGFGQGSVGVTFAWGFAVFTAAYVAFRSGAHLNPAVTLGFAIHSHEFAPGIAVSWPHASMYVTGQLAGAFVGSCIAYLAYQPHFVHATRENSLGIFSTTPAIRKPWWNLTTEIIATTVLVLWLLISGYTQSATGPLAVAVVVVAIGLGLGGPTGFAINPARDLGPRIAHALLPIKDKGSSDWGYAWIPIVGPLVGGAIAALIAAAL